MKEAIATVIFIYSCSVLRSLNNLDKLCIAKVQGNRLINICIHVVLFCRKISNTLVIEYDEYFMPYIMHFISAAFN